MAVCRAPAQDSAHSTSSSFIVSPPNIVGPSVPRHAACGVRCAVCGVQCAVCGVRGVVCVRVRAAVYGVKGDSDCDQRWKQIKNLMA